MRWRLDRVVVALVAAAIVSASACTAATQGQPPGTTHGSAATGQPEPTASPFWESIQVVTPDVQMDNLVETRNGWLAIGSDNPDETLVWFSTDLATWVPRASLESTGSGQVVVESSLHDSDAIFVGGSLDGIATIWMSRDEGAS